MRTGSSIFSDEPPRRKRRGINRKILNAPGGGNKTLARRRRIKNEEGIAK